MSSPECKPGVGNWGEYYSAIRVRVNRAYPGSLHRKPTPADNEFMPPDRWQQRIERAGTLVDEYPSAAQILHFYVHVAEFQRGLYQTLDNSSDSRPAAPQTDVLPELSTLLGSFPSFLKMLECKGSAVLAAFARTLLAQPSSAHANLLNNFWSESLQEENLGEFAARAFLQPYAEFIRDRSERRWENYSESLCPFCGRKPGLAILRQLGDGGQRSLVCSFCLAEWTFRRILCANCGEQDHAKLPVYSAEEISYLRIDCCDTCKTYLKAVDLTKNGLAVPVVDEIASVPLDLWAQERGYSKISVNLLQM